MTAFNEINEAFKVILLHADEAKKNAGIVQANEIDKACHKIDCAIETIIRVHRTMRRVEALETLIGQSYSSVTPTVAVTDLFSDVLEYCRKYNVNFHECWQTALKTIQ